MLLRDQATGKPWKNKETKKGKRSHLPRRQQVKTKETLSRHQVLCVVMKNTKGGFSAVKPSKKANMSEMRLRSVQMFMRWITPALPGSSVGSVERVRFRQTTTISSVLRQRQRQKDPAKRENILEERTGLCDPIEGQEAMFTELGPA